jgi:hypothetical protein
VGESLEASWAVMRDWWAAHGRKLRQQQGNRWDVQNTFIGKIETLHDMLCAVMRREASATVDEESKICALCGEIIKLQAIKQPNYGLAFVRYMVALKNVHVIAWKNAGLPETVPVE